MKLHAVRARIVAAMALVVHPGLDRSPVRVGHRQLSSLVRRETIVLWTALGARGWPVQVPLLVGMVVPQARAAGHEAGGRDLGDPLGQRDHRLRRTVRRRVSRGSRAARSTATSWNAGGTSPPDKPTAR
jgi:hypothetical protein